MGEVEIASIPSCIGYTRRYISILLSKNSQNPHDFVILCILITQYFALLYADIIKDKTGCKSGYYKSYPMQVTKLLPTHYSHSVRRVVSYRNVFCHEFGCDKCLFLLKNYTNYRPMITELINDVIFDDNLLSSETKEVLKTV